VAPWLQYIAMMTPDESPESVATHRPTVLIVDDTPDGREIYSMHLQHRGFTVLTACDGNEGVEVAREKQPDIVIMDLAMARLDGLGATRRLKRDARTRRIPVVILTAFPEKAVQQRAMEAGASVFLTKPCLPDQLEDHIRRLLAVRPAA
jgi:CheY-like chemotaxis protein